MKWLLGLSFLLFIVFILSFNLDDKRVEQHFVVTTKSDLGQKLFFDSILSFDQSISCASCHNPKFGFADNKAFSLGVNDSLGIRNTPSIMNMAFRPYFFYDGRAATLEEQIIVPIESPFEMNLPYASAVERVKNNSTYFGLFKKVYQAPPDSINIANALSEFVRSLESNGSSSFDRWMNDIDSSGMTASQIRGREIFISDEFKCFDCHFGPDFTGDEFRNIGLYDEKNLLDKGRFEISKNPEDIGKFKVPGLRNVALTAPYMHNGMFETLEEVIDYYSDPYDFVKEPLNMDSLMIEPLNLSDVEKEDLVNFLHSLTDKAIPLMDSK